MSNGYFNPDLIQRMSDERKKGRIFRAARLIREQSAHSYHSLQVHSTILKEIELLQDDEKYLKAMQEHTDAQEAQRQARQQRIQGE